MSDEFKKPVEILAAAKLIESVGAEVWMRLTDRVHRVSPDDLVEVVKNPDAWLAKHYGVTEERIRAWRIYHEGEQQCTATTVEGRRCLNRGRAYPQPNDFVTGESDRCNCHVDVSR